MWIILPVIASLLSFAAFALASPLEFPIRDRADRTEGSLFFIVIAESYLSSGFYSAFFGVLSAKVGITTFGEVVREPLASC